MARTCSLSIKVTPQTAATLDAYSKTLKAVGDYSKSKLVEDALIEHFKKLRPLKDEIERRMKGLKP